MPTAARQTLLYATLLALVPSLFILQANVWPSAGWHDRFGYIVGRDFSNFWMAGRLAVEGRLADLYDLPAYHAAYKAMLAPDTPFMNFSYLPNSLPLLAPLGALPYGVALALWLLAGMAAFAFAATGRLLPGSRDDATMLALLFAAPVALLTLSIGQASFLLAGLFVGGFRLLETRPRLAGVLFGLLTIKPQLGLLVPLVLVMRGQWHAIGCAALTGLGLTALSFALFGLAPWHDYIAHTLPYQARVINEPYGFAWAMMTTPYAFFCQIGVVPVAAMYLHKAAALGVAAAALLVLRRRRDASTDAVITALAAVIIVPYGLAYDLAIPAAALLWHLSARRETLSAPALIIAGLFWALPVVMILLNTFGLPVMPPVVAALFAALAFEARRQVSHAIPSPLGEGGRRSRPDEGKPLRLAVLPHQSGSA
jgi:hypothetical protein